MRKVAILGSTGSIGSQALEAIAAFPGEFEVTGLMAGQNALLLAGQARIHRPRVAVLAHPPKGFIPPEIQGVKWVLGGSAQDALAEADTALNALVGFDGLKASLEAVRAKARLCLANKESLVAGGNLLMDAASAVNVPILPVDSEHSAIAQCLLAGGQHPSRLVLTASGGPFRLWDIKSMRAATPEQALAHPTWRMGKRITIDSATLMNKALELVEAHYLFNMPCEKLHVLVHPQSIVHSMVEYEDGTYIAQMGAADMRLPVLYALAYPKRLNYTQARFDFAKAGALTFEEPDEERFPALELARETIRMGGTAGAVLNAADETAVERFLNGGCGFMDIVMAVRYALEKVPHTAQPGLEQIVWADAQARIAASNYLDGL